MLGPKKSFFVDRTYFVIGPVQTRTNQIIHGGIDNNKTLGFSFFQVERLCHENPCIAHDHTTWFHHKCELQILYKRQDAFRKVLWKWRLLVRICNAEPTPNVQIADVDVTPFQCLN